MNLRWENVDLKRKIFYFMNTKNGDNRAVPISSKAYELLHQHSKIRKINSGFVFARPDGKKPNGFTTSMGSCNKKFKY